MSHWRGIVPARFYFTASGQTVAVAHPSCVLFYQLKQEKQTYGVCKCDFLKRYFRFLTFKACFECPLGVTGDTITIILETATAPEEL